MSAKNKKTNLTQNKTNNTATKFMFAIFAIILILSMVLSAISKF